MKLIDLNKRSFNNSLTHTQSNHSLTIDATDFVIGSQLGYNEFW